MFSVSGAAADYTLVFQIRLWVPPDGNRRVPVWFYRSRTIWSWCYTFAVAFSLFSPLSNVVHCDLDIVTHYGQTLVSRVINASLCFPLKSADFNGSATCWGITKFREQLQLGLLHISQRADPGASKHIHKIDLSGFFFLYKIDMWLAGNLYGFPTQWSDLENYPLREWCKRLFHPVRKKPTSAAQLVKVVHTNVINVGELVCLRELWLYHQFSHLSLRNIKQSAVQTRALDLSVSGTKKVETHT